MRLALRLAARGRGTTAPNPMVGALVVRSGQILAKGYHRKAGEAHAEVLALRAAGKGARGGTLYVTLEPCSHTAKRTPPCTEAILASGVRRVVVGMIDPNPQVGGKGVSLLRKAGLDVTTGVCEEACRQLNDGYLSVMTRGRPLVTLKLAATLDGKIATASGDARWVTGEAARRWVHRLRAASDAVLVGVNTVMRDDPELTVRHVRGRNPIRVILDGRLRIPLTARVLDTSAAPTRIATVSASGGTISLRKRRALEKRGAEVLLLPADGKGRVDLRALLVALARRDVQRLLIEGGGEMAASALRAGVVDQVCWFQAPIILGGVDAKCAVGGQSPRRMAEALRLTHVRIRRVGEDWLITGEVEKQSRVRSQESRVKKIKKTSDS